MLKDTIVAIATPLQEGAISIVRLSGEDSFRIAQDLTNKNLTTINGNEIHHAFLYDNDELVDEVLISYFKGPKSYTGEDMIEINCHGGVYITKRVLSLCLAQGAVLAKRGEFTQRAYLNGRLDLSQAEAVNDMIKAQDSLNATSAIHSLKGSVQRIFSPLKEELIQIISQIEVNIDYPEYDDVKQLTDEEILPLSKKWCNQMDTLIQKAQQSVMIRQGIDTVILGKPNVGKSSLLNALLEEDKAIVTEVAGTTRDLVEGNVHIGEMTLHLIDTAGIHKTKDKIEGIGIEKSLSALEKAELVIVVLDSTNAIDDDDQRLLDLTAGRNRIVVYNKSDLTKTPGQIEISAANKQLDDLIEEIQNRYQQPLSYAKEDTLNNERQIGLAMKARKAMGDVVQSLQDGNPLDLCTTDLQLAYSCLQEITGESNREDLLDEVFSRFCLGK